ncbi:MAG: hypothetical protein AAGJ35_10615, partial [Myxococcota bacterium]
MQKQPVTKAVDSDDEALQKEAASPTPSSADEEVVAAPQAPSHPSAVPLSQELEKTLAKENFDEEQNEEDEQGIEDNEDDEGNEEQPPDAKNPARGSEDSHSQSQFGTQISKSSIPVVSRGMTALKPKPDAGTASGSRKVNTAKKSTVPGDVSVECWFGCGTKGLNQVYNIGNQKSFKLSCGPCNAARRAIDAGCRNDTNAKNFLVDLKKNHQAEYKARVCSFRYSKSGGIGLKSIPERNAAIATFVQGA